MSLDKELHELDVARLKNALEKKAGFWQSFTSSFTGPRLGATVGAATAAAGIAAAGEVGGAAFGYLRDKIDKPRAFKRMVRTAPGLRKEDPKGVQRAFNTLYSMNRDMAKDPLVASSFVSRSITRAEDPGGAGAFIDPQTVKLIRDGNKRKRGGVSEAWMSARPSRQGKQGK